MTKNSITRIIASLPCFVLLFGMHACTMANLDLCMDEHPHRGELVIEYDWSGMAGEHPDSMVVVALRPVFRDKVASNWATAVAKGENRLFGRFIGAAVSEEEICHRQHKGNHSRDSVFLPTGEWTISSYTSNPSTIELAKKYAEDVMDDGSQLYFKLDPYETLPEKYAYWYDRNPYGSWVDAEINSSVCLAKATVNIDDYASRKKMYKVRLAPRIVAQKINITFEAEVVDADITVDSIVCAVSGVAGEMNLNTLALNVETTHQTIFETVLSKAAGGLIRAQGTIYVPGLVRSSSQNLLQGPGILNASVFVNYTDSKGIRRERRLDATVNLFRPLSETPSVHYDNNGNVVQTGSVLNLMICSRMLISKNKLSNVADALDTWVDETIIDVEI